MSEVMPHWRIDSDILDTFEEFLRSSGLSVGYSEDAKQKLDFLKLYADKAEPLTYSREEVTEDTQRKDEILRAFSNNPNLVEALLPEELPLKNWSEKMFVDFCIENKLPMTMTDKLLKMFREVSVALLLPDAVSISRTRKCVYTNQSIIYELIEIQNTFLSPIYMGSPIYIYHDVVASVLSCIYRN